MIAGIGLDVVERERIAALLAGPAKEKFVARVLTEKERAGFSDMSPRRQAEYIAGRFAAKEAVVKALGCGIGQLVGFHDVEVIKDDCGKPTCVLSEEALRRLGHEPGAGPRIHVAITHERSIAAATAIIEH